MARPADWRQKRILVTGATGFIGQHLVTRLEEMDAQVYAGTSPSNEPSLPAQEPPRAERTSRPVPFDIRDPEAVQDVVADVRPDVVFHLAAVGATNPGVDPRLALMVNAGGVINLLEALKGSDVDRVILTGTSYEYGASGTKRRLDPFNAYAASKVAAWAIGHMYWRAHQLPVLTVRPFQVYGPGQPSHTLIPAAIRAAVSGEDFPMTPGEQERDFIFVEDVADGMIATARTVGLDGTSLDLGTGIGTAVRHVVQQIWQLTEAEGRVQPGVRPYRTGAAVHLIADADRTARFTGWRARTSLDEGLRTTMDHLKVQL
jgi:nucleoside-diphosphate-sugar epimerase